MSRSSPGRETPNIRRQVAALAPLRHNGSALFVTTETDARGCTLVGKVSLLDARQDYEIAPRIPRNPCAEELRAWIGRSALRDLLDKTVVPMILEELRPATPADVAERPAQFASLPETSGLSCFRARLRSPKPLPEVTVRKVQLFDLLVAGMVARSRAVAACHQRGTTLTLAFACDLHVAAIWDDIAAAVARYEPALARDLVHPHRLLNQFIDEANTLAARGDLDLVVLGGDLVDNTHTQPRSRNGHENG